MTKPNTGEVSESGQLPELLTVGLVLDALR